MSRDYPENRDFFIVLCFLVLLVVSLALGRLASRSVDTPDNSPYVVECNRPTPQGAC